MIIYQYIDVRTCLTFMILHFCAVRVFILHLLYSSSMFHCFSFPMFRFKVGISICEVWRFDVHYTTGPYV